jgi:hypothetical protein
MMGKNNIIVVSAKKRILLTRNKYLYMMSGPYEKQTACKIPIACKNRAQLGYFNLS